MRWFVFIVVAAGLVRSAAAASDPNVEFGSVDIGASQVRYMSVTADNLGATTLTSAQIESDSNFFTFAGNGCNGNTTCTFATPITLTSVAAVIPFRCSPPASGAGTHTAKIHFSDSPITPVLVCTATSGLLQLTPPTGVLDFGPIDLRRTPLTATSVVRIKNIGTSPVSLGAGTFAGSARFTATPVTAQVLAPGQELVVTVTYTPTTEFDPDLASITIPLAGPIATPVAMIALKGHGVDRHASLVSVGAVPDTFVKPGYNAPLVDVTIANSGGALMGLTGATLTSSTDSPWILDNPDAVDMPGDSSYTFHVRFTPLVAGPAPPATFKVTTTDPAVPTLTAILTGNGLDRMVTMGPAAIDMQYVAVGTTARISEGTRGDLLSIVNRDPDHGFEIRSLAVLGSEDAFDVVGATGTFLPPGTTRSFDVAFSPHHVGPYDATATLRLDTDPDPAATIALHGDAVFVDAIGGGGCSTTGGTSGAVVAIAILALGLGRRRARIVPRGFALTCGVLAVAASAHADTRNLDLAVFDPTPATTASWFQLQSAEVGREGDWAASALVSYANDPLVLRTTANDNVAIADRMMFELGGAFAFGDRFEAGAKFPLYVQAGENLNSATLFGEPTASGTAAGDLAVHAKARILGYHGPRGELALGVTTALTLPTATAAQFVGSGKPQLAAVSLVSFVPSGWRRNLSLGAQVGVVLRTSALFHNIDQGNGIVWAAGASYRARPAIAVEAELFGELIPGGLHDAPALGETMGPARALDAIEGLVGLHYQMERRVNLGIALGRGLTAAPGAAAWRGILAVTFAPTAERTVGKRRADVDSDHDGLPNDVDKCPDEPEDMDGFEDDDGCPDWDNDRDGVSDAKDKCPNVAEDRDGFEDQDGCPDIDNDHDGILDRFDHCPNEPETINGIDDEDGCPDKGEGLVTFAKDAIVVGETIQFTASGKIAPASFNALGQLGATLRAHTELIKIRVTAHAPAHAQTVVDWLLQYGIPAERLEATTVEPASAAIEYSIVDRY